MVYNRHKIAAFLIIFVTNKVVCGFFIFCIIFFKFNLYYKSSVYTDTKVDLVMGSCAYYKEQSGQGFLNDTHRIILYLITIHYYL